MDKQDIGLIGLAVMGANLALNIERRGYSVAVYNRSTEKVREFIEQSGAHRNLRGTYAIEELVDALASPRRIIMMVKAGAAVDALIAQLTPHLSAGDILVDGGNSLFKDTQRRCASLAAQGIHYLGTGISGGEEGALKGPSIMPGGPEEAYAVLAPVFTRIAAQVDDGACCTYIGPSGAGHFVKMVHNGIEYGDMQLIAEAYDILRSVLGLEAAEISAIFARWNEGPLNSYLVEITAKILKKTDPETGRPLVDVILDKAGQKGTGKWTSQTALDLGVAVPTINAAVEARILSSYKAQRLQASKTLRGPASRYANGKPQLVDGVHDALYASKICSYAQGMAMMRTASEEFDWGLDLAEISRIWKGGCIIRARFLDLIKEAYQQQPGLANLLLHPGFSGWLEDAQEAWRLVLATTARLGIPALALSASLGYFDSYRRDRLPQNLTQAQRDFFGAHTYERLDKEGIFHTEWQADAK
ncbi:MAG: NADP-dependent phosphogluconate dehydrogenase [Desulfobacterales bacterium]|nr:MAG: NADP-dependent phosphogluconate dehydrogenase [Desulfobacterales bacterium]